MLPGLRKYVGGLLTLQHGSKNTNSCNCCSGNNMYESDKSCNHDDDHKDQTNHGFKEGYDKIQDEKRDRVDGSADSEQHQM